MDVYCFLVVDSMKELGIELYLVCYNIGMSYKVVCKLLKFFDVYIYLYMLDIKYII